MDRVKIPSGSVQKLETVFDDLQTLVHGNLNKRIDAITGTYGTLNALKNDAQVATSTGLKVTVSSTDDQTMTIHPGVALLSDGSVILVETAFSFDLANVYSGSVASTTYYEIHLKWKEEGTDPIVAMNAFFFDKAGLTPYAERFSRWSDSYEVVAYVRTPSVDIDVSADEIPLAIVYTASVSTKLTDGDYTFQDISELRASTDNIIDIRKDYTYRISHDVLDDSLLVFKDRDSIGANRIAGGLEAEGLYTSTLTASGISELSTTNVSGILTVDNAGASYVKIKSGNTYNTGIVFSDTAGQRGYAVFDYNHNFVVGFTTSFETEGDGIDPSTPPSAAFVATTGGFIGNYINPTVELDLRNASVNADGTTIKISHVPATAAESTIFNIGVESVGTVDPNYGRGYAQPVTYNRPFEFLNLAGNYVLNIDNTNRKVYAYALEVPSTSTLSVATITTATVDTLIATDATFTTTSAGYITVSGLAVQGNDVSNFNLPGTAAEEFRVGVGSTAYPAGRAVVLEDPDVNTPSNFRIYDVSPSGDRRESVSYVHLKWNWDGLNGTKQSTDEVVLNAQTTTGETLNLTEGAATIRQFYFSSSGNLYDIDSYDATTRTVTLAEAHVAADVISDIYPAKIVDPNVLYYTIRAIELNVDDDSLTKRAIIITLDYDNIALDPEHAFKLDLNKKWSISIKAGNKAHSSPYVTMLPGVYDPDHAAGGQQQTFYSSPFNNVLPYIDGATSTPSLTLTATAYGFKLEIEGWESDTRDTSPHEFEVGYTTLSGITWENSSYSTTKKSGATFLRTINRTLQISTNQSTTWTVGVRPIQNNQPVGTPILGIVASGGGGIIPSDGIIVGPFDFNIVVASGTITPGVEDNEFTISGANNELWGESTLAGVVIYSGSEETSILTNTLRFTEE